MGMPMTALSFKNRFVIHIKVGLGTVDHVALPGGTIGLPTPKRQTIRSPRKRDVRAGEELQLYCGMRTKRAFLIGRARCTEVRDIVITFEEGRDVVAIGGGGTERYACYQGGGLDEFARRDGFESWADMRKFWETVYAPLPKTWIGTLIEWEPLQ